MAAAGSDGLTANRALITHFFESLGRGDAQAVEHCFADDVIFNLIGDTPISGRWYGKEKCWGYVAEKVFSALDVSQLEFSREWRIVCADGDTVVTLMRGGGPALNGVDYSQTYCHVFRIENGAIAEMHEFFDTVLAEAALFDNHLSKPTGRGGEPMKIT